MLLRQTLLYMPAQAIAPLFQLVSVIVWTHVIDEDAVGVVTLVTAMHELLQVVFLSWWSQYALRFVGRFRSEDQAARFYRTENAVLLASVVVQSLAAVVVLRTLIAPHASDILIASTVAYVATRTANLYLGERARARHEIAVYSIQQITGPTLGLALALLMIKLFGQAPEWPIAGYAIAQLAAVLAALPMTSFGRSLGLFDRAILGHGLRYGAPLIVGGVLGWIAFHGPRFLVNDMLGLAAAGLFAVGYGLGHRAAGVAAMLVTAGAFPIAVRQMEEGGSKAAMRQLADNGSLLAAVLLPCVGGVVALREEIVQALIAAPFQHVTLAILPLSALAGAVRGLRAHFGDQVFLLHNRTGLWVIVAAIEAAVTVVLALVCISIWGIVGGAIASLGGTLAAAVVSFALGLTRCGMRIPFGHLARITLATLAMIAALYLLPKTASVPVLVFHVLIGAAVYAVLLTSLYGPVLMGALRLRARKPGT
jgi:O-antigen/teichoic acid export membrane protein